MDKLDLLEATTPIVVEVLKNALEIETKWCETRDDVDRVEAYRLVLKDFMLKKDYDSYINSI